MQSLFIPEGEAATPGVGCDGYGHEEDSDVDSYYNENGFDPNKYYCGGGAPAKSRVPSDGGAAEDMISTAEYRTKVSKKAKSPSKH